jgi:hypothetical protein
MATRFRRGSLAYAKDGRSYVVDTVEDGIVYCSSEGGAEAEFPEAALFTEAEWAARGDARRDTVYGRLRQARAYLAPAARLDGKACEQLLGRVDRLSPGILDFTAFTTAERVLQEAGEQALAAGLSIPKCRDVFDAAPPEARAALLAELLGAQPAALVDAARLGENLLRALVDKGLAARAEEYEAFCDRPRR